MENDLLIIEAPSVSSGFRILNSLSNVKLIDAEPIGGGRFLIIAKGEAMTLKTHVATNREPGTEIIAEIIEEISQDVLDAVYSLASNKLDQSLAVVETANVTSIFVLAQSFVKNHGLRAIEIKIRKAGLGGAYAYFTGTHEACENAAVAARTYFTTKLRAGVVEVISRPSPLTRSLFAD